METKKYTTFRVTAIINLKVPMSSKVKKIKDVQLIVVPSNDSRTAGKKYLSILSKSSRRTLDHIVSIKKA